MSEFQDAVEIYSNFITPPDFTDDDKHTVILIDVAQEDVQRIAEWVQTAEKEYNVYIFDSTMADGDWLLKALDRAEACIVNTAETVLSEGKNKLAESGRAYYYGPAEIDNGQTRLDDPLNYFVQYDKVN